MKFDPSAPQLLADWHLAEHDEAALFMGCGLGKTAVVLHRLAEMFNDGGSRGALIVAPLRVTNLTWPAEVEKWDAVGHLRVANLRTKSGMAALRRGDAELYLCNYEMLPRLREELDDLRRPPFDTVVWDELTRAKNHNSKRINCIRKVLRQHCRRHWGMTGTPAPNSLLELFAQIRLLDGGRCFGPQFSLYRDAYFEPIDYNEYQWVPKDGARQRIYQRLEGFALTLLSSDWLHIPDVIQEDVEIALAPEAQEQYAQLEKELILMLETGVVTAVNAAVLVGKLLQVTGGAVYSEAGKWHLIHDAKIAALKKLLDDEPTIVFYQYQHELERLRTEVPGLVVFSDAATEAQQRTLINQWNARRIKVLAAHPRSMAHGLNMQQGGSTVVWMTLPWSREDYDQANARVARMGQEQITRIYRLITRGTVDEVVAETLRRRDEEQTALLGALRAWHQQLRAT